MKLGYTIIYVENVKQTIDFYEKAFGLKLKFLHESDQYAEMDTGETTLAFAAERLPQSHGIAFKQNRTDRVPGGFEIALVTNDVRKAFEHAVQEGAKRISDPTEKPWGQTVAYVVDNNGVLVEICSPISS